MVVKCRGLCSKPNHSKHVSHHPSRGYFDRTTIQAQVFPLLHFQDIFHDIRDLCRLSKDQNPASSGGEFQEDACQEFKFAGNTIDVFVNETSRIYLVFDTVKEMQMLANLAKLHEFIAQTLDTSWTSDSMYTFSKM
jgi:hypothetical protein